MVRNIDRFVEAFKDYPDCYTIIGGAACDILMSDAGVDFRATKDIDMILIIEDGKMDSFAETFWNFIKNGQYKCGWKNNPDVHFYRFTEPKDGYPIQIELFSRMPSYVLTVPSGIVPIHISDEISSLSAILLNDDYYNFMKQGRKNIAGLSILDVEHIIPFKMYAWLDLLKTKNAGGHVND